MAHHTHITVWSQDHLNALADIARDWETAAQDDQEYAEAQMYRDAASWILYQSRHPMEVIQIPVEHIEAMQCILGKYYEASPTAGEPAAAAPAIRPEMDTREALETALEALESLCAETDTASPEGHRCRLASQVVEMILAQKGCEHHGADCPDGKLTTLMDTIIFG